MSKLTKLRAKNHEDWNKLCASFGCNDDVTNCTGAAGASLQITNNDSEAFLIGVLDGDLSALVHKAAHMTFKILASVNVSTDANEKNETFCYMIDTNFNYLCFNWHTHFKY